MAEIALDTVNCLSHAEKKELTPSYKFFHYITELGDLEFLRKCLKIFGVLPFRAPLLKKAILKSNSYSVLVFWYNHAGSRSAMISELFDDRDQFADFVRSTYAEDDFNELVMFFSSQNDAIRVFKRHNGKIDWIIRDINEFIGKWSSVFQTDCTFRLIRIYQDKIGELFYKVKS